MSDINNLPITQEQPNENNVNGEIIQEKVPGDVLEQLANNTEEKVEAETNPVVNPKEKFLSTTTTFDKSPIGEKNEKDHNAPIFLFNRREGELNDEVYRIATKSNKIIGKEMSDHATAIQQAFRTVVSKGGLVKALDREGSNWGQYLPVGGFLVHPRTVHSPNLNTKISGVKAISHVRRLLGTGESREIPLYASGFYVTISPVSDTELTNLETKIISKKENRGRLTGGAGLSATSSQLVEDVVRMIIDNISDTNVDIASNEDLLDLILVTDIQQLALGQAQTIFPKGYPLMMPCPNDPNNCNHIEEATILPRNMSLVDRTRLTDQQKLQMASYDKKLSVKEVKEYQEKGPVVISDTVKLDDGIVTIDFRTPTIREYIEDSNAWFYAIDELVETIISEVDDISSHRSKLMDDQMRITTLRQYTHFIKSITMKAEEGEPVVIDDRETIMNVMNDLSGNFEFVTAIVQGVRKHIDDSTVSVAGIPMAPCPLCESDVEIKDEEKKSLKVVPIDAVNLFFTLARQKLLLRQELAVTYI